MCEIDGITCSGKGSCAPGPMGCICDAEDIIGEYCEGFDENYTSSAFQIHRWVAAVSVGILMSSLALAV